MTQNCWEATKCGRERFCQAYPRNGRLCYAVTGTLCRGQKQGSYNDKIGKCRQSCSFYAQLMLDKGVDVAAGYCVKPSSGPWQSPQEGAARGVTGIPSREVRPVTEFG